MNIDKMNLGELIVYCKGANIKTESRKEVLGGNYDEKIIVVDEFAMECNDHDTGISVVVNIIGAGAPYEIINGTYWKRGGYEHNKFKQLRGAWDSAFNESVATLMDLVSEREARRLNKIAEDERIAKEQEDHRKREVEALFQPVA